MPASDITNYPDILKETDWQAKKGKIAKLAGETGVGETMKKCEAAHKKVDWMNKYDISTRITWAKVDPAKSKTEVVDETEKKLVVEYKADADPIRKLLQEVRDKAKAAAAAWKKNKLIPSSSVKHAEAVANAAELMNMVMKENSTPVELLINAKKMREELERKTQETYTVVHKQIADCEAGLKVALTTPTKQSWEDGGAHQGCRSVCNGIAAVPAWKKQFYPTWQPFGNFYCKDIPDGDPQEGAKVKQKVATVAKELATYKAFVAKALGH
jgi:hypothetical protein